MTIFMSITEEIVHVTNQLLGKFVVLTFFKEMFRDVAWNNILWDSGNT